MYSLNIHVFDSSLAVSVNGTHNNTEKIKKINEERNIHTMGGKVKISCSLPN